MKLLLLTLLCTLLSADELQWVDKQINSILQPRDGLTKKELQTVKNPFIDTKKVTLYTPKKSTHHRLTKKVYKSLQKTTVATTHFQLNAIMNTKALINGMWYSVGNSLQGYKIISINSTDVTLTNGKKIVKLSTKTQSLQLKISK